MFTTLKGWARLSGVAVLVLCSALVQAQEQNQNDNNELTHFFSNFKTFKADLEQTTYDQNGRMIQEQHGSVVIQRPGKFLWVYQSPYEQQIIADGKKVWLYDIDLEQVTIKAQDQALGATPVSLLSHGNGLTDHFDVEFSTKRAGLTWYSLVPKQDDGTFERLSLGFAEGELRSMEVQDSFGQLSEFIFHNLQLDVPIDPAAFHFVIPEGVDVIDETEVQ